MPSGYVGPHPLQVLATQNQGPNLYDLLIGNRASQFWPAMGNASVNTLQSLLMGAGNALMAPGNALAGNYNQMEISPQGGVSPMDPRMIGDANNLASMVTLGSGAVPAEAGALNMGIKAYHGSPHSFDKFSMDKLGTGEGAQAYGHGLYFAENEAVAKAYSLLKPQLGTIADRVASVAGAGPLAPEIQTAKNFLVGNSTPTLAIEAAKAAAAKASAPEDVARYQAAASWLEANASALGKKSMYQVDISATPEHLLDFDTKLSEQSPHVQSAVRKLFPETQPQLVQSGDQYWVTRPWDNFNPRTEPVKGKAAGEALLAKIKEGAKLLPGGNLDKMTGGDIYRMLANKGNAQMGVGVGKATSGAYASNALNGVGVPGLQYLDQGSRVAGDGTRNYVVFDDKHINIERKYSKVGGGVPNQQEPASPIIPSFKLST